MARMYSDSFTNDRRLAWVRSKCQAEYRGEGWTLTFAEFCQFWSTQELFSRRGRSTNALVMVRKDNRLPWSRDNCALITRVRQLGLARAREANQPTDIFFQGAIEYGH